MMELLTYIAYFLLGLIVGLLIGIYVYRNNRTKEEPLLVIHSNGSVDFIGESQSESNQHNNRLHNEHPALEQIRDKVKNAGFK
jgi:2-iminoacetate synthase ThiH